MKTSIRGTVVSEEEVDLALGTSAAGIRRERSEARRQLLLSGATELDIMGLIGCCRRSGVALRMTGYIDYLESILPGRSVDVHPKREAARRELEPETRELIARSERRLRELHDSPEAIDTYFARLRQQSVGLQAQRLRLERRVEMSPSEEMEQVLKDTRSLLRSLARELESYPVYLRGMREGPNVDDHDAPPLLKIARQLAKYPDYWHAFVTEYERFAPVDQGSTALLFLFLNVSAFPSAVDLVREYPEAMKMVPPPSSLKIEALFPTTLYVALNYSLSLSATPSMDLGRICEEDYLRTLYLVAIDSMRRGNDPTYRF